MIPFLLLLAVGVGQQAQPIPIMQNKVEVQPASLKCGKYEVEDYPPQFCGDTVPSSCYKPRCVPIMHPLKESEYQEIMEKLKAYKDLQKFASKSICYGLNWTGEISLDGGRTTIDCASIKPKYKCSGHFCMQVEPKEGEPSK